MKQWFGLPIKKNIVYFHGKGKSFVVLPITNVLESHALFNGNFFMTLYSVDSDKAMKRWSEAMKH
jgi:hypothetical protein